MENCIFLNGDLTFKLNSFFLIACRIVSYIVNFDRDFLTLGDYLLGLVFNLRESSFN